jgi:hypothetical protein
MISRRASYRFWMPLQGTMSSELEREPQPHRTNRTTKLYVNLVTNMEQSCHTLSAINLQVLRMPYISSRRVLMPPTVLYRIFHMEIFRRESGASIQIFSNQIIANCKTRLPYGLGLLCQTTSPHFPSATRGSSPSVVILRSGKPFSQASSRIA